MQGNEGTSAGFIDVAFFRPHSLCIAQGVGGGGAEDFGEFFLEGKGGMVNISEGRNGRMPVF